MMATHSAIHSAVSIPSIEPALLNRIIDSCFDKMSDDYRVNRFFNNNPIAEKTKPLQALLKLVLNGSKVRENIDLLDQCFTAIFAKNNAKPSLVTGNDFVFLLDVIGGRDLQVITPLCMCHNFLLKLLPDDSHYDVMLESLQAALQELNVSKELAQQVLALAESGREGTLGRIENFA
jgi:hemoglobin